MNISVDDYAKFLEELAEEIRDKFALTIEEIDDGLKVVVE